MDELNGWIDNEFFDRKAGEFRLKRGRLMRDIQARQSSNQSYVEEDAAFADRQLRTQPGCENGNFDEWRRGGDSNPR